jgi:hypothetical protein
MNAAGHRNALDELRRARAKLDPIADIRAYAELTHGMAIHAVAAGAWQRHGVDQDNHQGIPRWLRQQGYEVEATAFGTIASIRTGHWYGRQGNGDAAHELDILLAQLEAWSVA